MKHYRLYIMILLSFGIHLGALGYWGQMSRPIHVTTDLRGQTLNVVLTKPQTPAPQLKPRVKAPTVKLKSVKKQTTLTSETKTPESQDKLQTETNITAVQPNTVKPIRTEPAPQKFALLNNDMIKELHSEFRARFKYPMLARKRGWQGKVVLALHINLQGKIADIAVKRSSGYMVLDHNAVNTFKAIGKLSPNLHDRIKKTHSFNIPIIYQLNGG